MIHQRRFLYQAIGALVVIWLVVFATRSVAGSKKMTAERIQKEIASAQFDDWSQTDSPSPAIAKQREKKIREIADMTNRLDFQEREKNRDNRSGEEFFRLLNSKERNLFIDLTVAESMNRFMQALDQMPAAERKRFVKQGLEEVAKGRTAEDMQRTRELGDDVMEKITQEGMRAYFEKSSAETKLDLAPLMESMNEVMQGLRGNRFGPPRR
jgi:DNA-directed RNA polymerase specialized sigma24 family protein